MLDAIARLSRRDVTPDARIDARRARCAEARRASTPSSTRARESEFAEDRLPGAVNWPSLDDAERARGRHRVQAGLAVRRAQARRGAGRRATSPAHIERHVLRQAARLDAARLLLARRPAQRRAGHGARPDRLSRPRARRRLPRVPARRRRRARDAAGRASTCASSAAAPGSGKSRLLQALRAPGRAGARPRGAGQPPRLGAGPACRAAAAVAEGLRHRASGTRCAASTRPRPVFVESESRKIGELRVPEPLLERMRAAPLPLARAAARGARRIAARRLRASSSPTPTPSAPARRAARAARRTRWSTPGRHRRAPGATAEVVRDAAGDALRPDLPAVDAAQLRRARRTGGSRSWDGSDAALRRTRAEGERRRERLARSGGRAAPCSASTAKARSAAADQLAVDEHLRHGLRLGDRAERLAADGVRQRHLGVVEAGVRRASSWPWRRTRSLRA